MAASSPSLAAPSEPCGSWSLPAWSAGLPAGPPGGDDRLACSGSGEWLNLSVSRVQLRWLLAAAWWINPLALQATAAQIPPDAAPARRALSASSGLPLTADAPAVQPPGSCRLRGQRHVDAIVFGDEPAGLLTALELSRQLRRRRPASPPRLLVLSDADTSAGLGGTLARGWLAYLDRNQLPSDLLGRLPPFAPSSDLYARFLRDTGVRQTSVDPQRASRFFRRALRRAAIPVWDRLVLRGVRREGDRLCVLEIANRGSVGADLYIDASLAGVLARAAAVPFQPGLGPGRLASKSLSLGWIFTVDGLSLQQLQEQEERLTWRLLDPRDRQAQQWLRIWPPEQRQPRWLMEQMLDDNGKPRLIRSFSSDSADQQSPAMSLSFHGQVQLPPGLEHGPALLDRANVALLGRQLNFNALLFRNDADQNRRVLAGHNNRPLPAMRPVARTVEQFFRRLGARRLRWAPELYVRSSEQIAHPRQVLDAATMAFGGVPEREALGTFTDALDLRGGLPGIRLPRMARPTFNFGYRHTLPREVSNLAVLGPAGGFGGLAVGAGRIIELNVSVGQGLAIAAAEALQAPGRRHGSLAAVNPYQVAERMPHPHPVYGRPSGGTLAEVLLRRLRDLLDQFSPHP